MIKKLKEGLIYLQKQASIATSLCKLNHVKYSISSSKVESIKMIKTDVTWSIFTDTNREKTNTKRSFVIILRYLVLKSKTDEKILKDCN